MRDPFFLAAGLLVVGGLGFAACAKGSTAKSDDDDAVVGGGGSGNTGTGNSSATGGHAGGSVPTGGGGTSQGGSGGCIPGLTPCNNQCVDLLTDELHCGGCDTPCSADRYCNASNCVCNGGTTDCSGTCINTLTDNQHCGNCTTVCAADRTCTNSSCTCAGGLTDCGGACVNTATNHDHCGFLCLPCGADEQCTLGFCTCNNAICGLCPDDITDIGSTVPQTVNGSTSSASDYMSSASCGSSGGYDVTYRFTAPAAATYTMSLCGSSFDTVLYVENMSCSELQCDDDGCGSLQSQLSVTLTGGQQVLVVVDGFDDYEYGSFTLSIQ